MDIVENITVFYETFHGIKVPKMSQKVPSDKPSLSPLLSGPSLFALYPEAHTVVKVHCF